MSINEITSVLWRRRVLFGLTFAAAMIVVGIITVTVPKTYRASATVFVGTEGERLDTSQGEQLSRTYTAIASNPNIAQATVEELELGLTRTELLEKMSFIPIERTALLDIRAEDSSPQEAQRIANGYANVFSKRVESAVLAGRAPSNVAVSQPAIEPTSPIRPNPPLYLGFGALLSLLLAAAAALLADRLDPRLRIGPREETFAGQPILGRIPVLLQQSADGPESEVLRIARILRADAFRLLRTNLDLSAGEPARTIAVTSPGAGEGKSTIVSQLALTLATDGERVTVVECDLRRGPMGGIALEGRSSPGLAEYLAGEATAEQVVTQASSMDGLRIVWAGATVAEPGPLLRSPRFQEFLSWLGSTNDWVLLDTPPIGVGDDALVTSSHADGALVVISNDATTGPALERALGQLGRVSARVLGLVLNRAPVGMTDAYQYLSEPTLQGAPQTENTDARDNGPAEPTPGGQRPQDPASVRDL